MTKNLDYNLLVQAERVRFQSDYSGSHWLHQVLCKYERGMASQLRRDAFEAVIRCAISFGCAAAVKLAATYPAVAGFPTYLNLECHGWKETAQSILNHFEEHEYNRFRYVRDGD